MKRHCCCWPLPSMVVKWTALSGGGGVATRCSSYWYVPRSELCRVSFPVVSPTFRGRNSNAQVPCEAVVRKGTKALYDRDWRSTQISKPEVVKLVTYLMR